VRALVWLFIALVVLVVAANNLPERGTVQRCTATITADDGTTRQVPC
jgi:hypothetical protein